MELNIKENKIINEKTYIYSHSSGLRIIITPKKGFSKTTVMFGTYFGSLFNKYKDKGEIKTVPDGIAHFLEHKLFESEEGDAFTKYAVTGASANAYTSFNNTVYYFTCTDKLKENIKILVDLMQTPYFTKENVDKEQGIIGQEIKMYDDSPEWRGYFNMINGLYLNNTVKIDIAGTVETIAKITPDLLYECYNKFYAGKNMAISICGDVDPNEIAYYTQSLLTKINPSSDVEIISANEPKEINKSYIEQSLDVIIPSYNIGYKYNNLPEKGKNFAKKYYIGKLALSVLFGKSSKFYNDMYEKGVINDSFDYQFELEKEFAHVIFSGESENPKDIEKAIQDNINNSVFSKEDFKRSVNIIKSDYIKGFNNTEYIARYNLEAYFNDYSLLDISEIINEITVDDINTFIGELKEEYKTLSVIKPNK